LNWRETITKSSGFLESKGVPDAAVAAELLAARLLRTGRGTLAAHLEKEAGEKYLEAMRRGLARLAKGEPVQYVIGEWDFRHLTLKCDRRALIPRPETEELVTRVLAHLKRMQTDGRSDPPLVVDVGTGTGAIILSLAQEFGGEAAFLGTDISEEAIALAKENAERCGLSGRVKFAVADGLDDFDEPECVDVIVSNPPYIESAVCETLDPRVRDYEPRLALDGGASGLDFYDRYLGDALNVLKPGGAVFFEIGEAQGPALAKLMSDYGFSQVKIEKDFAGHDRYASGVLA
jgi:release factor glutamine methyltransferase